MIKIQPPVRIYHPITMVALTGLLVLFAACQTAPKYIVGPDVDRNLVTKASLPDYVPGEYFVYDDGTSVLVAAVKDDMVTWKHHNGAVSTGYPNFIIPDLTWTSADRSSQITLSSFDETRLQRTCSRIRSACRSKRLT